MATINKKLIHFKLRTEFEARKAAGDILDTSICWIQDAKLIYTHGTYYDCTTLDLSSYVTTSALMSALNPYALSDNLAKVATSGSFNDLENIEVGAAGTYGPSDDVSGTDGTEIKVPQITTDAYGRVVSVVERTYTSVNTDTNTTYTSMTSTEATAGTSTSKRVITPAILKTGILAHAVANDGVILNIAKVTALPSSPDANTLYVIVEA